MVTQSLEGYATDAALYWMNVCESLLEVVDTLVVALQTLRGRECFSASILLTNIGIVSWHEGRWEDQSLEGNNWLG